MSYLRLFWLLYVGSPFREWRLNRRLKRLTAEFRVSSEQFRKGRPLPVYTSETFYFHPEPMTVGWCSVCAAVLPLRDLVQVDEGGGTVSFVCSREA